MCSTVGSLFCKFLCFFFFPLPFLVKELVLKMQHRTKAFARAFLKKQAKKQMEPLKNCICIYIYLSQKPDVLHMWGLTLEFENGELSSLGRYWRCYWALYWKGREGVHILIDSQVTGKRSKKEKQPKGKAFFHVSSWLFFRKLSGQEMHFKKSRKKSARLDKQG